MATNLKIDFDELYKSVFKNSDEVQLLTEVESRFVRDYMKPSMQMVVYPPEKTIKMES